MRIDKEKLKALTSLSDEALWEEIKKIGKSHGFTLPDAPPKNGELGKVRRALGEEERINLGEAIKIINQYRKGR